MSLVPPVPIASFLPITVQPSQSAVVSSILLPITSFPPATSTVISSPSVTPSGGGGSGSGLQSSSLVNSASLYLYTFLATLILLLSVAAAVSLRTYVLRRRHERMVDLAIRNGTYVPQTPPPRPARVDLSRKPKLWEAYLGGGGLQQQQQPGSIGSGSGKKELDIVGNTNWKSEYSRDWQSIKPICAGYAAGPLISGPYSGSTPDLTTSLAPPVSIPSPIPRGDDEENRRTTEDSTGTTNTTTPSLLTRARIFFNPNHPSTVPASSSADNGANLNHPRTNPANISMTELSSNSSITPPKIKVAVFIAMPSPSHGASSSSSSTGTSSPLSASLSSSSERRPSHPLELSSPSGSPTTLRFIDEEDQPSLRLPHLEMGVAHVVISRSENSLTWGDSAHTSASSGMEDKTIQSRGS